MNRRNFFKTIGIPVLFLPIISRLNIPEKNQFLVSNENNELIIIKSAGQFDERISLYVPSNKYTLEELLKEIKTQARKYYPKAEIYCTERNIDFNNLGIWGNIIVDLR